MHPRRTFRNTLGAALLAATTALALAACSGGASPSAGTASPDAVLTVGSTNTPTNLDQIAGGSSGVTEVFTGNVYEGLFRITDSATVEPLLAKTATVSPDGLTYTFGLQTANFHSGAPVTAADVKYSLERFISTASLAARKKQLSVIDSVSVVDDKTVAVKLKQKSISFTYNLGYVWIINHTATDISSTEDGSGPYTLKSYHKGDSIALDVNKKYWGTAPKNGGAVFKYFTDATAMNNALLTKAVDVVTSEASPDALGQFSDTGKFSIIEGTSTYKELLAFNDKVAPFNNVTVRKALYSAINREQLLKSIWDGRGQLIGSMVPPSEPWYLDLANNNPYDVNLAKKLLADAGFANGFSFTLQVPNNATETTVAEFVKSELAKVNVKVTINLITDDQWYANVYKAHDFQATLQQHVNDRDINFYGDPNFYFGYNNPDVQNWLAQSEAAPTAADQAALVKKANQQISDDAASVWLYLNPQIRVSTANVRNVPKNGLNSLFYISGIEKVSA
ncbi:ABC transporter substrate-binding protein [Psychromicrobium xiongbiense]|uniref:ABC transporter substrate-binding protein n=1 Tax=Psychromicrobium xiongbiense TaxID=3051184 RepID=UPI0025526E31|nr:ABC transporter substrate-binding protein [Psychromicrobium sp. YIM S02556]